MLEQTKPEFLDQLDTEPGRAWEDFHAFAWRLLRSYPPAPFSRLPPEVRDDLTAEIVADCCAENFRKLRTYQDRGLPFAAWFARIARNRALVFIRRLGYEERYKVEHSQPFKPDSEHTYEYRLLLEAVRSCMQQLGQRCRLLLEAAADEFRPAEIAVILGLPPEDGKRISDSIRGCRKTLRSLLRKQGLEQAVISLLGAKP